MTLNADLTLQNGAVWNVTNGLTVNNAKVIFADTGGGSSDLWSIGTQTLGGTEDVIFAGSSSTMHVKGSGGTEAGRATLTIGRTLPSMAARAVSLSAPSPTTRSTIKGRSMPMRLAADTT